MHMLRWLPRPRVFDQRAWFHNHARHCGTAGVLVEASKANGALYYSRAKELQTAAPPSAGASQSEDVSAVMSIEEQSALVRCAGFPLPGLLVVPCDDFAATPKQHLSTLVLVRRAWQSISST